MQKFHEPQLCKCSRRALANRTQPQTAAQLARVSSRSALRGDMGDHVTDENNLTLVVTGAESGGGSMMLHALSFSHHLVCRSRPRRRHAHGLRIEHGHERAARPPIRSLA